MKNTFLFPTLLWALLSQRTHTAPPSTFPEPGPFSIVPTSASEPLMFRGGYQVIFGSVVAGWRGNTLYVEYLPVECERSSVSLAQAFSFSAVAFLPRIHFLDVELITDSPTAKKEVAHPQRGDGKFNFNIGYQF